jgi:hypothetical protein
MELDQTFQRADPVLGMLGPEFPVTLGASLFDCWLAGPHLLAVLVLSAMGAFLGSFRGHGELPVRKERPFHTGRAEISIAPVSI